MRTARKLLERKLVNERRLGEMLIEEGLLTEDQLNASMKDQQAGQGPLTELLVQNGFVNEWDLAKCLVSKLQLPFIFTETYDIPRDAQEVLPAAVLHQHRIVPLDLFGKTLLLATTGNITQEMVEEIELSTNHDISLFVALISDVQLTLRTKFPLAKVADQVSQRFDQLFKE